jgi:transcriptional regulator
MKRRRSRQVRWTPLPCDHVGVGARWVLALANTITTIGPARTPWNASSAVITPRTFDMRFQHIAGSGMLAPEPVLARESRAAQEPSTPDPTLYIPKAHLVEERKVLHDFMDEFAFVDLVTTSPTLRITHIPTVLDRTTGVYGTIFGHISAQNPQRTAFDGAHTALIVFRGPHGYISPTWYAKTDGVPTWNFSVVHASGRPRAVTDKTETRGLLSRLITKFESVVEGSTYDFAALPEPYVSRMMEGIAPFRMEIDALEGKFKLGQERPERDRQGLLARLRKGGYRERSLYEVTEAFYRAARK